MLVNLPPICVWLILIKFMQRTHALIGCVLNIPFRVAGSAPINYHTFGDVSNGDYFAVVTRDFGSTNSVSLFLSCT